MMAITPKVDTPPSSFPPAPPRFFNGEQISIVCYLSLSPVHSSSSLYLSLTARRLNFCSRPLRIRRAITPQLQGHLMTGWGGGSIATVDERTIKHRSNHRAERAGKGLKVHHLNASLEDIGQHASFLQQRITLVRLRFYYCACSRTMCSMSFNVDYLRLLFFERDGRPDVPSNIQDDDQQLISEVPGMKIV